jgi:hypothetical protein
MTTPAPIKKVGNVHDAMIDWIIANPTGKLSELAETFGYTTPYVSRLTSSDIFQARLHERKAEVVNPLLTASVEDRMNGLMALSLDVIESELERTRNPGLAVKSVEVLARAGKFGAKPLVNAGTINNYIAVVPQKAATAAEWAERHAANGGHLIEQD